MPGNKYSPVENYGGTPTSGEVFTPVTRKEKVPTNVDRGPFENSPVLNPYGISRGQESYGRSGVFGGPGDMLKSIGTRKLAIDYLTQRMQEPVVPQGLSAGLDQYAMQNPYLASMVANYQPALQAQGLIQDQSNQAMINELLQGAYVLGGGIYGGAYSAWAAAKEQDKARKAARNAELQAIVGGAMRGLGLNQYGEADTTQGLIGGLEL